MCLLLTLLSTVRPPMGPKAFLPFQRSLRHLFSRYNEAFHFQCQQTVCRCFDVDFPFSEICKILKEFLHFPPPPDGPYCGPGLFLQFSAQDSGPFSIVRKGREIPVFRKDFCIRNIQELPGNCAASPVAENDDVGKSVSTDLFAPSTPPVTSPQA